MNPYEAVGVAFGVIYVWLTVRENIWFWPNVDSQVVTIGRGQDLTAP